MAYRITKVARLKGPQFKVRYEWFENKIRKSRDVPKSEWAANGFANSMTWEEANAQKDSLNAKEHLKRHEERKNKIHLRMKEEALVQLAHLPAQLVGEFEGILFGRRQVSKKTSVYWKAVKNALYKLALEPHEWIDNKGKFYDYFSDNEYSISYSVRLIAMLNRWGYFYSRKTRKFFEPLPYPRGHERELIADANYNSGGGGNKESDPITPEMLESKRSQLSATHYNWIYITVWLGLRPIEVDGLHDGKTYRIEKHGDMAVLAIYMSKLTSIPRDKRWKLIPCFLPEQQTALKIITEGDFKRPLSKSMASWFGETYGNYGGRKNFEDLMRGKGQSIEDICQWMGHTDISRTYKSYKNKKVVRVNKVA